MSDSAIEIDNAIWALFSTMKYLGLIERNPYFMMTYEQFESFLMRMEKSNQ